MEKMYYEKMVSCIDGLIKRAGFKGKKIFLFGHCDATEEMHRYLKKKQIEVEAILDNNINKQGNNVEGVRIVTPAKVLEYSSKDVIVLISSRAYAAMKTQLRNMGYGGQIIKVVDYNTFVEHSLSQQVLQQKLIRLRRGYDLFQILMENLSDHFLFVCPYRALGDVYYAMAYMPYYLRDKLIEKYAILVVGNTCKNIVQMFTKAHVEVFEQNEMDELVQVLLYKGYKKALIVHHDRPYTNDMTKLIDIFDITFRDMYCIGVYGKQKGTNPTPPIYCREFSQKGILKRGKSIILSPYAKSVVGIEPFFWKNLINKYKTEEFELFTNVTEQEVPLCGTTPLYIPVEEIISAVEYAGYFIGIRSGLCDIISTAKCNKTVVYKDTYYSITGTKNWEFFALQGWTSIIV